jgi:hypothetical protein
VAGVAGLRWSSAVVAGSANASTSSCTRSTWSSLDGQDLRREPLETRKATLASLLRGSLSGLRLNEHLAHDGESVFRHACKMGLEGIVSKRLGSRCRSGRPKDGIKMKNPAAPAVRREGIGGGSVDGEAERPQTGRRAREGLKSTLTRARAIRAAARRAVPEESTS